MFYHGHCWVLTQPRRMWTFSQQNSEVTQAQGSFVWVKATTPIPPEQPYVTYLCVCKKIHGKKAFPEQE